MLKAIKLLTFLTLVFNCSLIHAQGSKTDTVSLSRDLIEQAEFIKAGQMLIPFVQSHQNNLEATWLLAHVYAKTGDFRKASVCYKKAVKMAPADNSLKLEYARVLFQYNRLARSGKLLSTLKHETGSAEAYLLDAYINFWYGDFKKVKNDIENVRKIDPSTDLTKELEENIETLTAFNLSTEIGYQTDNQPLKSYYEKIEANRFYSRFANFNLKVVNYNYNPKNQAIESIFSDQLLFGELGLELKLAAGIYSNFKDRPDITGTLELTGKPDKRNRFILGVKREPYIGTIVSTGYNLLQDKFYASYNYSNQQIFDLHLEYNLNLFTSDNNVKTLSGWLLTRQFRLKPLSFQVGYGINYSDAKLNLYVPVSDLSEYPAPESIKGIYDPYFTPHDQLIHSALMIVRFKPLKRLDMVLKGNYGFAAQSSNPYFTYNENAEVVKDYSKINFHPYSFSGILSWSLKRNMQIRFNFSNQETYYYNITDFSVGLNYSFGK